MTTVKDVVHTPGPWFIGAQNDGLFIIDKPPRPSTDDPVHDAQVAVIAHVYYGNPADLHADANARLIATAPEMLQALRNLVAYSECSINDADIWNAARAAIAKAEGRHE